MGTDSAWYKQAVQDADKIKQIEKQMNDEEMRKRNLIVAEALKRILGYAAFEDLFDGFDRTTNYVLWGKSYPGRLYKIAWSRHYESADGIRLWVSRVGGDGLVYDEAQADVFDTEDFVKLIAQADRNTETTYFPWMDNNKILEALKTLRDAIKD